MTSAATAWVRACSCPRRLKESRQARRVPTSRRRMPTGDLPFSTRTYVHYPLPAADFYTRLARASPTPRLQAGRASGAYSVGLS
jgi:hypothetical protein